MQRKRFFLALENADNTDGVAAVPAEELVETAAAAEEVTAEVVSETGDVAELQEAIEEGLSASDELADVGEVVEAKVEDGEGLSADAAQVVEIAIERIRENLGMPKSVGRMPAMENFKSPRGRHAATKIALEASISETIKMIWTKIKEFAQAVYEKVKAFIGNLVKNYGILEQHLEKLKARAQGVSKDAKKEKDELAKPALAKFFSGVEPTEMLATVSKFHGALDKVLDAVGAGIGEGGSADAAAKAAQAVITGLHVGKLPNGAEVKVEAADGGFDISFSEGKDGPKTIKALSADEVVDLTNAAISVAKGGKDLKDTAAKTEKITRVIIASADKVIRLTTGKAEGDESKAKQLKAASKATNSVIKVVSKMAGKLPALHFATVKNSADLASASLANLKSAKAEPAAT